MRLDLQNLPTDIALLHQVIRDLAELVEDRDAELDKLRVLLSRLKRMKFGRSSEKRDPDQLLLALETVEEEIAARAQVEGSRALAEKSSGKAGRKPLPAHLPREEVRHEPEGGRCPGCGGKLHRIGEDTSEVLDYVPAQFRVIRHVRPRFACRACETITQMPAPSLPIEGGRPSAGLLAQVMVAKYCDHTPLYRQSEIYRRVGGDLHRSTLAGWVGRASWLLKPLGEALSGYVLAASKLHGDDTPVPVLDPGRGKTKQGHLWVYLRDDRNSGDESAPAALFRYSPDRKGMRPAGHLEGYKGYFQADAYSGYDRLYEQGEIIEVGCWAHARRKIFDVYETTGSPIAAQALEKIAALYEIEARIRGRPPDRRRSIRQGDAVPLLTDLEQWLRAQLAKLAPKSTLAGAFRYALAHRQALTRYLDDGQLEIDNNLAENALRPVCLGRKNYLFAGSDAGGERAALLYSLLVTCRLNDIDPYAYLSDVLARIADHPVKRVAELLPFNWATAVQAQAA